MKNFIICLPAYPKSMAMAEHALVTGKQHSWDIELFHGVDGRLLADNALENIWGIKINQASKKCRAMMERPGVQGCFLSHWQLWKKCSEMNETIGIFEHDIEFLKPLEVLYEFDDILKLEGFELRKPRPAGEWYEGARGYLLTPTGATKLLTWVNDNGGLSPDVLIGLDVVNIVLQDNNTIQQQADEETKHSKHINSFTWNLENMTRE